jgi:hypothetical protein
VEVVGEQETVTPQILDNLVDLVVEVVDTRILNQVQQDLEILHQHLHHKEILALSALVVMHIMEVVVVVELLHLEILELLTVVVAMVEQDRK